MHIGSAPLAAAQSLYAQTLSAATLYDSGILLLFVKWVILIMRAGSSSSNQCSMQYATDSCHAALTAKMLLRSFRQSRHWSIAGLSAASHTGLVCTNIYLQPSGWPAEINWNHAAGEHSRAADARGSAGSTEEG